MVGVRVSGIGPTRAPGRVDEAAGDGIVVLLGPRAPIGKLHQDRRELWRKR